MNVYAEAVKKGGDSWSLYMPEKMSASHVRSNLTPEDFDDYRMYIAEKYPDTRRIFQKMTLGES